MNDEPRKPHRNYAPLCLVPNRSYPSYQLYATVSNKKTPPADAFKIVVLTVLQWMREKFKKLDLPEELKHPAPEDYKSFSTDLLKSFRIDRGYVVEVVYIDEINSFSLQLVEPDLDLGSEHPNPVAGRVFTTNIGVRIRDGIVECGFNTMVSDPENVTTPCNVYRLSPVKRIVRNPLLGLTQVTPLVETATELDSSVKTESFRELVYSDDRYLPILIFTEVNMNTSQQEELSADISVPLLDIRSSVSFLNDNSRKKDTVHFSYTEGLSDQYKNRAEHPFSHFDKQDKPAEPNASPAKQTEDEPVYSIPYDIEQLAHDAMGYCHVYTVKQKKHPELCRILSQELSEGDVCIVEPKEFGGGITIFPYKKHRRQGEQLISELSRITHNYCMGKEMKYGKVLFTHRARLYQQEQLIKSGSSLESIVREQQEHEKLLKERYEQSISSRDSKIKTLTEKIDRLQEIISEKDCRIAEAKAEAEKAILECELKMQRTQLRLDYLESLDKRPETTAEIPKWVSDNFEGRILFHNKAVDLITKTPTQEVDMKLLCDAIEYLATEYYEMYHNIITEEEAAIRTSRKYNRPFEVTPSGTASLQFAPTDYKIKYNLHGSHSKEQLLDRHLKAGVASAWLIRIYFLYDSYNKIFVVGSLPKHLKTLSEK